MRNQVLCANVFYIVALSFIVEVCLVAQTPAQILEDTEIPEAYQASPDDDEEMRIKKEIVRAIQSEVEHKLKRVVEGQDQVFYLLEATLRLQDAQEAVHAGNKQQLVKIALDTLSHARKIELNRVLRFRNGVGRPDEAARATAFRLQCELRLLQIDPTEYEKYKRDKTKLSDYCNKMFETAKRSKVLSNLGEYNFQGPLVTMEPRENFELRTKVWLPRDSGGPKLGYIFLKAVFDGSEYQTQEFYFELEGKRTNLSDGDQ